MADHPTHRSGFVNIMGAPNVGKSTLLNALIGEKLSIITNKPQTTRHRIIAIINEEDFQIVFSDTPGIIDDPGYKMQQAMNQLAFSALDDADVLMYVIDITDPPIIDEALKGKLSRIVAAKILVLNKIDLSTSKELKELHAWWSAEMPDFEIMMISALEKSGIDALLKNIVLHLPESPPYYPKDQFTDRSERFFVSEIIREKILQLYHQEIPYSCEVIVTSFKEDDQHRVPLVRIRAEIIVSRNSQKGIVIGKKGAGIKQLGITSREEIEKFLEKKVFLELFVKVKEKWRDDDRSLRHFGYLT